MMSSEIAWALPLLAGFWIVFHCQLVRLASEHLKQPVVVLLAGFIGVWFGLAARLIICLLHQAAWFQPIESSLHKLFPWDFAGTGLVALLLALIAAEVFNRLFWDQDLNAWVVNRSGSEVVRMLHQAMLGLRPVILTLDNREVYVGFVQAIPNIGTDKLSVRILRLGSGYRDPDTLVPHVAYSLNLPDLQASELLVAIPLDAVKNVSIAQEDHPGILEPALRQRKPSRRAVAR